MDSYLLIGQSNMAGRGEITAVENIIDPKIKLLRNGRWQGLYEPVHFDRPFSGIGPAASFAACLRRENPDTWVGLIPCADGGSTIDEWQKGEALFDHAVFQAKLAQRISNIKGILWHQGESDTNPIRVKVYKEKLAKMFCDLREELDLKETPLYIGALGDFLADCPINPNFVNYTKINDILLEYANENENTYFVTAKGLTANPDLLHFDAQSQRMFGIRYATAALNKTNVLEKVEDEENFPKHFSFVTVCDDIVPSGGIASL